MALNNDNQSMPTPAPANSLPIGTRMHEYEIKAVIGEGGFGIVYLATDTLLGREVAIKEYLPLSHAIRLDKHQVQARSPEHQELFEKGLKSFVAEAKILAQFRNPNLVEVMRFWEGNGTAYIVMPYYKGKTLRQLQQKGFRATDQVSLLNLLIPLLNGLQQVHKVGCFHRDISPDNIVVLPDGSPLLLDFGAARHEIINQADASTVILKPGFAPIEQYGGKETADQQGPWTDIYALSAVGYQLITGVMPPSSVARIMRDPLTPLAEQASGFNMPLPILKAIDAGLQVQAQDRPQSIAKFRAMLLAKEPAAPAGSDEARVHQQSLAKTVAKPPAAATAAASVAAAPATAPKQRMSWLWLALIAGVIGLALAVFMFARTEPATPAVPADPIAVSNTQAPQTPPAVLAPSSDAIANSDAETNSNANANAAGAAPQQGETTAPVWQEMVVPRADGSAPSNTAAVPPGQAPTGTAVSQDPSSAVLTDQPGAQAGQAMSGAMSNEASLQENESLVPDASLVPGQTSPIDPLNTAEGVDPLPETEPEELPVPTVGFVVVQAQPWGDVYLNGELVGTTPPSLRIEVPLGSNTIEVRNDSAASHVRTFNAQAGQTVRINHNFAP
ncbi:serine/threonine-protein kinase [Lampropedia aestuarii]|nr:serine/threonine-protein kinase [Lampropedia aestuarii]